MADGLKLLVPNRETEKQKINFLGNDTILVFLEIKMQHLEYP